MKLNDCIFFSLNTATRRANKFWKDSVREFNVTGVQAMTLNALLELNGASSVDLGNYLKLDSATMTGILDRLELQELVQRVSDASDRRVVRIKLSKGGLRIASQIHERAFEANREFLSKLNAADKEKLRELLLFI